MVHTKLIIHINAVMRSSKIVFSHPAYILLGILVALLLLLLAIWLPNISFLKHVAVSESYSFSSKVNIFWHSLGFLKTNFSHTTRFITFAVAILSGINISLLVYYLIHRITLERAAGTGLFGTIAGLLGVGCASCGSVILSSIVGLGASTSFLGILPFKGIEFGILGIVMILFSIQLLAKKIQNPLVCNI